MKPTANTPSNPHHRSLPSTATHYTNATHYPECMICLEPIPLNQGTFFPCLLHQIHTTCMRTYTAHSYSGCLACHHGNLDSDVDIYDTMDDYKVIIGRNIQAIDITIAEITESMDYIERLTDVNANRIITVIKNKLANTFAQIDHTQTMIHTAELQFETTEGLTYQYNDLEDKYKWLEELANTIDP